MCVCACPRCTLSVGVEAVWSPKRVSQTDEGPELLGFNQAFEQVGQSMQTVLPLPVTDPHVTHMVCIHVLPDNLPRLLTDALHDSSCGNNARLIDHIGMHVQHALPVSFSCVKTPLRPVL